MKCVKILIALCLNLVFYSYCFGNENLFYVLRSNSASRITSMQNSFADLTNHYKSIDILVSQAYQIDENGMVWGYIDPEVLDFVNKHSMKLMVLVTNVGFNTEKAHRFLENPQAQTRAINTILKACKKNKFYGVQLDYESIRLKDRENLTKFYVNATKVLHKNGFVVSYAIAPVVAPPPQATEFLKKIYEIWEGAYDLQTLGKYGDFVTIMAYNQHGQGTTPGPTADIRWVEKSIKYTLKYIPAEKISLGIPAYSSYWFTGTAASDPHGRITSHSVGIDYKKVEYLLHKYHTTLTWDSKSKINYTIYDNNWLNEYIFVEDTQSFAAKFDLVKKYHLRGISVFDLGTEDKGIWNIIH